MSVRWDSGNTEAHKTAYEFDEDSKEWREYCALRESVIYAMLVVGFPTKFGGDWKITNKNWKEVYARLSIFERATYSWRSMMTHDGQIERVYFTPDEIKSLVGLEVNAGNKSDAEFNKLVMQKMRETANDALTKAAKARAERERPDANSPAG